MAEIRVNTTGTLKLFDADDSHSASIKAGTLSADVASITLESGETVFNEDSADIDFRIEGNGDANAFFLDGEVDRIYLGHNADTDINGLNARLQISGTDFDKSSASLIRYSADANPPSIGFAKSRNASIAGNTIVQDGDNLGRIRFAGADGGDFANVAGQIDCQVDGTPGVNDMPGRLIFSTGADGATSATERVRIHSGGVMSASQGIALGVGTANTASNVLDDYEEGTFTPALSSTSATFAYTYQKGDYTKVGNAVTFNINIQLDGGGNSFSANAVSITGLPFTSANVSGQIYRFFIAPRLVDVSGSGVVANLNANSTTISILEFGDNNTSGAIASNQLSSSSGQLFVNGTYYV